MVSDLDSKYMQLAFEEAQNANCAKGKVEAIIIKDGEILSKGNNSVPTGCVPCTEETCIRKVLKLKSGEKQELCRVVHAEQNAILNALFKMNNLDNSSIYVTKSPCMICAKIIINSKIKKVYYANKYPDENAFKILHEAGIETIYCDLQGCI